MAYGWHASTYEWHKITYEYTEWHTDKIRVHTSDIRMIYEYIRVTYGWHEHIPVRYGWHASTYQWHTADIRVHTVFGNLAKFKRGLELAFSAWVFHTNSPYLIIYQLTKFERHIILQDIKQNVLLSSYLRNWWRPKF